jgi:hypothetical protein
MRQELGKGCLYFKMAAMATFCDDRTDSIKRNHAIKLKERNTLEKAEKM